MKLTDKNYDLVDFKVSKLVRLLLILRIYKIGSKDLQIGYKEMIKDMGKLSLQHHLGNNRVLIEKVISPSRRCLHWFKRIKSKL